MYPKPEDFNLLRKKGIFPYDYMDDFEKFKKTKLPHREAFFNKLTNQPISTADYLRAQNVWNNGIKNLGKCSDLYLYLKTDVILLADVFDNFRKECLVTYSLDPAQYFTAPGLSWDAMLKIKKIKLNF
jgi:hypothetical protein